MMKKKILIVSDSTRIGGIQKSLVNLLNFIDYKKYDVSLLLFDNNNISKINKNVKVLPSYEILRMIGCTSNEIKNKSFLKFLKRKILSLLCFVLGSDFIYSIIYKKIELKGKYDIAISFSNNVNTRSLYFGYNKFVIEKVNAKKKMCWIHIDYLNKKKNNIEKKEFTAMDQIVLVSEACKNNFDALYPEFKDKTKVVYNTIDKNSILKDSNLTKIEFENNFFNVLSIGRIEKNKNILSQVNIASKLYNLGYSFKWYVIGNGVEYKKIKKNISKCGLSKCFILLGEKENVYPYIKNASMLVSTSFSESFGYTIAEALSLDIPVLALDYPALKEIITKDSICQDENMICEKIISLIEDKKRYDDFKKKCSYMITEKIIDVQIQNILGGSDD